MGPSTIPLADLRGGARDARPPPGGPNSFIFMQFSRIKLKSNSTFGSWRTPLGKILDPPLHSVNIHTFTIDTMLNNNSDNNGHRLKNDAYEQTWNINDNVRLLVSVRDRSETHSLTRLRPLTSILTLAQFSVSVSGDVNVLELNPANLWNHFLLEWKWEKWTKTYDYQLNDRKSFQQVEKWWMKNKKNNFREIQSLFNYKEA